MIVKTGNTEIEVKEISVARINKSKSFPWRYTTEIQFSTDNDLTTEEKNLVADVIEKTLASLCVEIKKDVKNNE